MFFRLSKIIHTKSIYQNTMHHYQTMQLSQNNSTKEEFKSKANKLLSKINLNHFIWKSAIAIWLMLVSGTSVVIAQGNLLITPRRVVFEGAKKIQELNLANIGNDTARYVLSMVEIRMKDDGSFETITEPDSGQFFATPYLRFFPRSVVLGPNESQLLKVQITKANQLAPGEYRSHVYFRAVRDEKPLGEIEAIVDSNSISVSIIPIFGITIPIIIRVGELTSAVSLNDITCVKRDTVHVVGITFNRTGNMSVYGDLRVEHTAPDGKVSMVGQANGVAVYTPNTRRRFELPLTNPDRVDLSKGSIHVRFLSQSDLNPGQLADAEFKLTGD